MTIPAHPPLSRAAETALVKAAQKGDVEATAVLVRSQVLFLRSEARTYGRSSGVGLEDLVSAGVEAFVGAIGTFDSSRGTRLVTHAKYAAAEAMAAEVAVLGFSLPVPGRTLRKYRKALRDADTFEAARGRAASAERMAPETFVAVHAASTVLPLDRSDAPGDEADDDAEQTQEGEPVGSRGPRRVSDDGTRALAAFALSVLTDRERFVVEATVMAPAGGRLTDVDAAAVLGCSRATASRLRRQALPKMRDALGLGDVEAAT